MEYVFTLKYQLADSDSDLDALVERLGAAGCDDALVGVGQPGRLALEFSREAGSAAEAVHSALVDVKKSDPFRAADRGFAGSCWPDGCSRRCGRFATGNAKADAHPSSDVSCAGSRRQCLNLAPGGGA